MQDVIFSGSDARKATGLAEVSLYLSGVNGTPDGAERDVVLTRRLFRDGESEYCINGARSRLKDIQELLREARIGAQTYATIEQGRIEQILNAKPKERRLIIEEAAGVSGFKHKRRLAELKLEATQANLLRVSDIVGEVSRQIGSLKRQAAKARRYQRLRDELRQREQIRFGVRARQLDSHLARLRESALRAGEGVAFAAAGLAQREAEVEAERLAIELAERELRIDSEACHRIEMEIERAEARIRSCREKIEEAEGTGSRLRDESALLDERRATLRERASVQGAAADGERGALEEAQERLRSAEDRLAEAEAERAAIRGRLDALRGRLFETLGQAAERRNRSRSIGEMLERHVRQRARVDEERAEARGDAERAAAETASLDGEIEAHRNRVQALRDDHQRTTDLLAETRATLARDSEALAVAREHARSAAASLHTLEDVATRFAGVSDGVTTVLTVGAAAGVRMRGVVADFVEAAREYEAAAENYLRDLLPAVMVEEDADASRAARLLRETGGGRTAFLAASQPAARPAVGAGGNGRPPFPEALLADSRVRGTLRDRLQLSVAGNGMLRDRIGDAVLVDNLESALELHRRYPDADYLAETGEVVLASGLVHAGGSGAAERGLLAHTRRIHEARSRLVEAETTALALQAGVDEARQIVAALEEGLSASQVSVVEAGRRLLEMEMLAQRSREERDRSGRRAGVLADEAAALEEETARLRTDLAESARLAEEAEREHQEAERRARETSAELEAAEGEAREAAAVVAEQRADVLVRGERVQSAEAELGRQRSALHEVVARLEAIRAESEAAAIRAAESRQALAANEAALVEQAVQLEQVRIRVAVAGQDLDARRAALSAAEESVRGLRSDLDGARQLAAEADLARAGAESDRRHLDDLCLQELGIDCAAAASALDDGSAAAIPDTLEAEIADLKAKIDGLGPVNLTAIDEYAGLEERHNFLVAQQKDLQDSMESLRNTIRRINASSRERFVDAFEQIRSSFQEVFRGLFNGGRADLRLEEGDDVLECGIEILVQPPGKRLGNVQLLSGGEKAMSAIALLFAIFKYRPSPFCVLDEVDAALDDVNVGRFTRMLRDYSKQTQFILVTHNKRSMEVADLIYGVTMDEPGISRTMSVRL